MFYKNVKHLNVKIFSVLMLLNLFSQVSAHEMWIEPVSYVLKVGDTLYAHEKVGQNFKGNELAYLNTSYESLNLTIGNKTRAVKSRLGDIPAIHEKVEEEGLFILSAVTPGSTITYKKWSKFESFIKGQGLDWVLEKHKERKLETNSFSERYKRYPKSLIKVGDGKGEDQILGLPLEWVAQTNPYTSQVDMRLQLLWKGKPYAQAQVDVFHKKKTDSDRLEIIKSHLKTDDQGRVTIPYEKGEFLINAVYMRDPTGMAIAEEKNNKNIVWESLWASLTYSNL